VESASESDVVIHPGELFFGRGKRRVHTLLGSCVAVTFWHARQCLGGMCHYVLFERSADVTTPGLDGRYGAEAITLLHQAMLNAGTRPHEYLVKLFGGGNMFPTTVAGDDLVGQRNVAGGRHFLLEKGFSIASEDVAGSGYRVVQLDLGSGEVSVRYQGVDGRKGRRHG
jgi:chemotaxis protein CheD